jgi:hypothetical protein
MRADARKSCLGRRSFGGLGLANAPVRLVLEDRA